MIYLEHPKYGVLVASGMPKYHANEYTEITEDQYKFALEEITRLQKEKEEKEEKLNETN